MTLISHHLFRLKHINKLNVIDEFASEIDSRTECNGDVGCNANKLLPVLSIWAFIGSSFWKGTGLISTYCCFGPYSIQDLFVHVCCIFRVVFFRVVFLLLYFSYCVFVLFFLCCIFCVIFFRVVFIALYKLNVCSINSISVIFLCILLTLSLCKTFSPTFETIFIHSKFSVCWCCIFRVSFFVLYKCVVCMLYACWISHVVFFLLYENVFI